MAPLVPLQGVLVPSWSSWSVQDFRTTLPPRSRMHSSIAVACCLTEDLHNQRKASWVPHPGPGTSVGCWMEGRTSPALASHFPGHCQMSPPLLLSPTHLAENTRETWESREENTALAGEVRAQRTGVMPCGESWVWEVPLGKSGNTWIATGLCLGLRHLGWLGNKCLGGI